MRRAPMLDLYTDHLLTCSGTASATSLSSVSCGSVSHDSVTNFLSSNVYSSKNLWLHVKPLIRKAESADGVLIVDDTIEEKPYTDENDIVCWHYDHSKGRSLKGINLVNMLVNYDSFAFPVAYEIVKKTDKYIDPKDGKEKRRCDKTKNAMFLDMLDASIANQIKFKYVLADIWFSSNDNMEHIKINKKRDFIFGIKGNRTVALSLTDKLNGKFQSLSSLPLDNDATALVYIKGLDFPILVSKKIFINEDGSEGILYLATSDLELDGKKMYKIYQKRWKIEEYHKSLKQNAALAKSPTKTVRTQSNHIFASIYAFCKLQVVAGRESMNHFAIRARLLLEANKIAFREWLKLKTKNDLSIA